MAANPGRVATAARLEATEFEAGQRIAQQADNAAPQLVDVRNPGEVALGTIEGAVAIPVGQLADRLDELDPALPTIVFCAGGYRSSVAASLLRHECFGDVSDIIGGYASYMSMD